MKVYNYYSPLGPMVVITHGQKLVYCNWDTPDCMEKEEKVKMTYSSEDSFDDLTVFQELQKQLDEYFEGKRFDFNLPLELSGSEFSCKVWETLSKIKYGDTVTYAKLAEMIGSPTAVRAVASACGKNPLAVILPCHRVVTAGNGLGGYTGGIDKKKALLELEKYKNLNIFCTLNNIH